MTDLKSISDILITEGKVRGKPVAISLFRDSIPSSYEPFKGEPCSIVHAAMDEGKKVYFDSEHQNCFVGIYHAGMHPGTKEIVSGEYLSKTTSFFTYEGAARLKAGTRNLPPGMVKAIGAAPLDAVPDGVQVDWIVVVCNPHNANNIAGCRVVIDGVLPHSILGTSLCGDLFSAPWHEKNIVVTHGDFGGRMHNRIKQDQLFVIIPIEFVPYLPNILVDMKFDVKASMAMTKKSHSKISQKHDKGVNKDTSTETTLHFSMDWDEEARELINKAPEGIIEMAVENAEDYARKKNYPKVTRKSLTEQMEEMGMDLDQMLG